VGQTPWSAAGRPRPAWFISLWFQDDETIDIATFQPNEEKAYKAAKHFANVLHVPLLDSDGKETSCSKV